MTAPLPPGERPTPSSIAPFPLVTAVAAGIAVAGAVLAAPDSVRAPLAWGGGVAVLLLCTAVALAAHGMRAAKLARGRLEAVTQDAGRLLQERARLAEDFSQERGRLTDGFIEERARLTEDFARERVRLTDEFAQERARLTGEFDQERTLRTEEFDRERDELTTDFSRERDELTADFTRERDKLTADFTGERDKLTADVTRLTAEVARLTEENARLAERARHAAGNRAAAVSVTGNVAGRMQALATGMLADLRGMEERHADEEVLTDLLYLDHRTAQAGRLADSVAVLAGARSGRRWARPIVMESILRGAMGRIGGYQRVRVHSSSEAAVAGHAAEGVMHALAELLDNAANFSPPTAEVHVYVEEVPAGVIVSVEDSGLVMSDVQLRRAERAVSGESSDLGGLTGTRLGLAVVGRLARKHGLKVSFRPSARGGTGVLVLIPQDILSLPTVPAAPAVSPAPAPAQPVTAAVAPTGAAATGAAPTGVAATGVAATGVAATGADPTAATSTDATSADAPPAAAPPAAAPSRPLTSYAAARSPEDLDPDPVPTHESPERGGSDTGGLPKRRRGRALAEAERGRPHATGRTEREPRTADDAKARVARFSSFRQAVRGTMPDQATVQGTTTEPTPEAPVQAGDGVRGEDRDRVRVRVRAEDQDRDRVRAEDRDQDRNRPEAEGRNQAEGEGGDQAKAEAKAEDRDRAQDQDRAQDRNRVRAEDQDRDRVQAEDRDQDRNRPEAEGRNQAEAEAEGEGRDQAKAQAKAEDRDRAQDQDRAQGRDRVQDRDQDRDRNRTRAQAQDQRPTNLTDLTKPAPPTAPPAPVRATAPAAPVQDPATATPSQSQPHPQSQPDPQPHSHAHAHPEGDTTS
ncbi:ATP-binding protein [Streptomyces avermitilis]|uniref:ATP-binding protein n=1 Tax=Streptomyces avermitilis TaxID=33903 RepID=UPI0033B941D4